MALPDLRHFTPDGISSDPVEALAGEAWLPAIYTDKGWATADGASLLLGIEEWRYAAEEAIQSRQEGIEGDGGVQAGNTAKRQARPRQRAEGQKP